MSIFESRLRVKPKKAPGSQPSGRLGAYIVMGASSITASVSAVGLPVHLDAAGLDKNEIAVFFVVNAVVAILYNLLAIPRIAMRNYPAWILRASCLAVPAGILVISFCASAPALLYLGGGLMLLTTMTFPQILGIVSREATPGTQEKVVATFRQVMVAGYIAGLGILAISEIFGADALLVAATAAIVAAIATWSRSLSTRFSAPQPTVNPEYGNVRVWTRPRVIAVFAAIILVGLMKATDSIRSIYLPLYTIGEGHASSLIPLLFGICALSELLILPFLARSSAHIGSSKTLAIVSASGMSSFAILLIWNGLPGLIVSQVVYAIFAAGFQSVGLLMLSRAVGRDAGVGAGIYVAVIQVGTMLGAALPLLVEGYGPDIFLIAIGVGAVCVALSMVLNIRPLADAHRPNRTADRSVNR